MTYLILIAMASLVIFDDPENTPISPVDVPPPREAVVCGPNCVLLMLTMSGYDVDDAELNSIDVGKQGASLLQLKEFCAAQGLATEVRKVSPEQFAELPTPAIMHVNSKSFQHFDVVFGATSEGLLIFNGTTGERVLAKNEKLAGYYSGYVLVPTRSTLIGKLYLRASWLIVGAALISCVALGYAWATKSSPKETE